MKILISERAIREMIAVNLTPVGPPIEPNAQISQLPADQEGDGELNVVLSNPEEEGISLKKKGLKMQSSIVASVQFKPEPEEIDKNISIAKQMAFEAAAKGARVIVLPEMCTSGNGFKSVREAALCAQSKDGYQTESFIPLARKFNCHIVFGYPEFDDNFLYNSAAIVGPNGLEANIRKHNLWGNDNFWATSSDQIPPVVVTAAGRLGALISRDISNTFRESYAFYKKGQKFYSRGSVDTLALLSNWDDQFGYPDSRWIDLNESLDSNLIVSNRVGSEGNLKFRGGSCIIGRDRKVWTNGSSFKESAVVGGMIII